jgi:hypothetical protein
MLRSSKEIEGCAIGANDGQVGCVTDFYFDDQAWIVRYLVVATGLRLAGRKVLISPVAIDRTQWLRKVLSVSITIEQVRGSPDIDAEKPVSRRHEMQLVDHYRYPPYWGGVGMWGPASNPSMMPGAAAYEWSAKQYTQAPSEHELAAERVPEEGDPHLRSCNAVVKSHLHALDGDIGHLRGLLVDDETWAIRYLIADTSNWWLGHQVLIVPQWIDSVSWSESRVFVNLTRRAIQEAPPYDESVPLDRTRETELFEYYGRSAYRADDENRP